ncbi:DUF5956 family protein [Microbacterium sp. zg.Y909]|uniref:DUF5956 family protein n=1 Tax=Microbacterium sp. zg.Y909 TaxID=2969413 RepID=UPI0035A85ABF
MSAMSDSRWEEIPGAPPRGGTVVALGPHLRHSLIAYLAGPRHVQRVPRRLGDVVEQVHGEPPTSRRPSDAERDEIQSRLVEFLAEFGIPAPPADDEWRLYLPPGVCEDDLWAAVNGPEVRHESEASPPEVLADLRTQLKRLLGPLA